MPLPRLLAGPHRGLEGADAAVRAQPGGHRQRDLVLGSWCRAVRGWEPQDEPALAEAHRHDPELVSAVRQANHVARLEVAWLDQFVHNPDLSGPGNPLSSPRKTSGIGRVNGCLQNSDAVRARS